MTTTYKNRFVYTYISLNNTPMITKLNFRDISPKQFSWEHLEKGEGGKGGTADRGGDQNQAEAATQSVLPEHRPTKGEPT